MSREQLPSLPVNLPEQADLFDALTREFRESSARTVLFHEAVAERLGMNTTDHKCLDILSRSGPITPGQLADLTGLTTGAVTGVVDRLERAGFARRTQDSLDRRRVILQVVDEQVQREFRPLFDSLARAVGQLCSQYSAQDLALILDFTTKSSRIMQEEAARLRTEAHRRQRASGDFSAPLGDTDSGRLVFASGAAHVILGADPSMQDLYRARFEGSPPSVQVQGGSVTIQYRGFPLIDWRKRSADITLNGSIPWQIEFRGGLSKLSADLRQMPVSSVEFSGGASTVDVLLPKPAGTVPIRVSGGASKIGLHRPIGVAVRVHGSGGASKLALDDLYFGGVGGEMRWESPDYASAVDRYDIIYSGGASKLTIDAWRSE